MRAVILLVGCAAATLPGCKNETAKAPPATKPSAQPAARAPQPSVVEPTRGPTTDHKDIQGVWQTSGDRPVQLEFAGDTVVERAGPGPAWTETSRGPFKLDDQAKPRRIDWGSGPDARYGLYTIDGKTLIISYATGGPENRPKRLDQRTPPYTQLWLERPKQ